MGDSRSDAFGGRAIEVQQDRVETESYVCHTNVYSMLAEKVPHICIHAIFCSASIASGGFV